MSVFDKVCPNKLSQRHLQVSVSGFILRKYYSKETSRSYVLGTLDDFIRRIILSTVHWWRMQNAKIRCVCATSSSNDAEKVF